tara:strand:+ start:1007 stop:1597 length:591 start_codon:yes stop_codon:yes gene_type:complete
MSQLNVDQIKNRAGTGPALEFLTGGNYAFDTDTLYIDTSNNRIGINTSSPELDLHVTGTDGMYLAAHPMIEKVDVVGSSTNSSTTVYCNRGSIHRYTSTNNGNWTPDFRFEGSSLRAKMNDRDAIVQTLISPTNTGSGYTAWCNIDGYGQTVEWSDGEAPDERGGDGGYDVYQFTIIATGTGNYDWLVLANQTNMN